TAYSYCVVMPLSTRSLADRSGSRAHRASPLRIARIARLVATGFLLTNSRFAAIMQQKYCDQGRSIVLLTTTCPIFFARSSCVIGGVIINASILPSARDRTASGRGLLTQRTS